MRTSESVHGGLSVHHCRTGPFFRAVQREKLLIVAGSATRVTMVGGQSDETLALVIFRFSFPSPLSMDSAAKRALVVGRCARLNWANLNFEDVS